MKSPLKFHGGKSYLAKKIVALFPPHKIYVEPYAGGLSVLLAHNPENCSEIVNDLNKHLTNFWTVLKHPHLFNMFYRQIECTPFSELEYKIAKGLEEFQYNGDIPNEGKVLRAIAFFIRSRQSLAGRQKEFTSLTKTRLRRGMCEQVSAWLSAIEGLPEVHARLKRVLILKRQAIEVIEEFDVEDCVMYLDPPYPSSTRVSQDDYEFEMDDDDHEELLDYLTCIKHAKFFLSTYENEMYSDCAEANGWKKHVFKCKSSASHTKEKQDRQEIIYTNHA